MPFLKGIDNLTLTSALQYFINTHIEYSRNAELLGSKTLLV